MEYQNTYIPVWSVQDLDSFYAYAALPFSRKEILLVNLTEINPFIDC
jgi:hypothetical protein